RNKNRVSSKCRMVGVLSLMAGEVLRGSLIFFKPEQATKLKNMGLVWASLTAYFRGDMSVKSDRLLLDGALLSQLPPD
ncbi:MAG: hypothetical protein WED11_02555, partial [Natronospirillum sp.]